MKKPLFILSLAVAMGNLSACSPSLKEQADQKMNELIRQENAIGLSVAVVKDNKLIYTGAFGIKSLEDSSRISTDDIFRIASISKSFTATAIMQLHEAGKFNLDDDISPALGIFVRNPNYPDIPITYRMLLTHTSSLNDTTGYFSFNVIDPDKTPEVWRAYNRYAPGTQYEYCNLGFNLLGALIEIHSGERFDCYIKKHIINPLGMNAGYNVDSLNAKQLVSIYDFVDGKLVPSPDAYKSRTKEIAESYVLGRSTPLFSPTGGMKIAPKDLAKHMLIQMNGGTYEGVQILKPESVTAMQTPYECDSTSKSYGLALETNSKLIEGETLVGHTGSAYGVYSAMFFEPNKKFGIIMITNGYPAKRADNGFMTIQTDVINALYDIFIREGNKK